MMNHSTFQIKRIYDDHSEDDGYRVLLDRLWPRGVSKEQAQLDEWCKEIAPSTELRKWFDHDPDKFDEFGKRYKKEIANRKELVEPLIDISKKATSYLTRFIHEIIKMMV